MLDCDMLNVCRDPARDLLITKRTFWVDRAYADHFFYGKGVSPSCRGISPSCRGISPSCLHDVPRPPATPLLESDLHCPASLAPVGCRSCTPGASVAVAAAAPMYSVGPPLPLSAVAPALLPEGLMIPRGFLPPPPFALPPAPTPPSSAEGPLAKDRLRAGKLQQQEQEYLELYECRWAQCDCRFACMEDLVLHVNERHVKIERPDVEFQCRWEGCPRRGRGFNARYKMLIHIRTHTNEKPHKCLVCGKSFSRLENLKIHNRSHTGEKPYICPVTGCNKAYSNSSDRFKHVRTHQEQKPYICKMPGCLKRYTDPSSLRKHVRTHGHFYRSGEALSTSSSSSSSSPPPAVTSATPMLPSSPLSPVSSGPPASTLPSRSTAPSPSPSPSHALSSSPTLTREEELLRTSAIPHPFLAFNGGLFAPPVGFQPSTFLPPGLHPPVAASLPASLALRSPFINMSSSSNGSKPLPKIFKPLPISLVPVDGNSAGPFSLQGLRDLQQSQEGPLDLSCTHTSLSLYPSAAKCSFNELLHKVGAK